MRTRAIAAPAMLGLVLGGLLALRGHLDLQRELAAVEAEVQLQTVDLEAHAASTKLVQEYKSQRAELERWIAVVNEFRSRSLRPEALVREIEEWRRRGQSVDWLDLDSRRLRVALGDPEGDVADAIRKGRGLRALGLSQSFELKWSRPVRAEEARRLVIVADRTNLASAEPGGVP